VAGRFVGSLIFPVVKVTTGFFIALIPTRAQVAHHQWVIR
jgi:hypothetical protein